jgi:hypothetical protein
MPTCNLTNLVLPCCVFHRIQFKRLKNRSVGGAQLAIRSPLDLSSGGEAISERGAPGAESAALPIMCSTTGITPSLKWPTKQREDHAALARRDGLSTLKGTSGTVGFLRFMEPAQRLERLAREG